MCNYTAPWASRVIWAAPALMTRQGRGDRERLRPGWNIVPQLRPGSVAPNRVLTRDPEPEAEVEA